MKIRIRSRRAITILELMIVLIILSILSVSVYSYYGKTIEDARLTRAKIDMEQIKKEVKKYHIKAGHYPDNLDQLKGNFHIPQSPFGSEYRLDTARGEVVLDYKRGGGQKTLRVRYRPED